MATVDVHIPLNAINLKIRNKTVAVRILRLWAQKDRSGKEGLEMILVDEWCNKIQASISVGLKKKFMPFLTEGNVIVIKNFQAMENKPNFQNAKINHQWMIAFGLATKVFQPQLCFNIKENGFDFIPFSDISTHDSTLVLDILGEVKTKHIDIETVEMRYGKATKCDILLEDADGTQVTCVLWGIFADELKLFMENKSSEDREPVIVALQFAMISKFKGATKVSSMKNCTKIFIRPDIQEVKNFILRRSVTRTSSSHTTTTNISIGSRELKVEEWLDAFSARSIKDLINSDELGIFTCKATIVDFHPQDPWYYEACGNDWCFKGVTKANNIGAQCKGCMGEIRSTTIRYCMKALVEDDIEGAYFTIFEDCASYFLKKTAVQVMKEMEQETGDRNGTPELLTTMLQRECLFKVEARMRSNERVYTVKNVTEDAHIMTQFSSILRADEVASKYKESSSTVDDKTREEEHIEVHEETCSNSTSTLITPQKRGRIDSSQIDVDCGDLQFSATKKSKKLASN